MPNLSPVWLFDLGAAWYDILTANPAWQANCGRLLDGVPAGAGRLRVLDLGVGPGVSALAMSRRRPEIVFIGLDLSRRMLAEANGNRSQPAWPAGRLALLRADAARLPLRDGQVDVVTGHSFLYLLPDYRRVLAEAVRVLRPGGRVAFLEPHAERASWQWLLQQGSLRLLASVTAWRFYSRMHRRFSERSLSQALAQAGLGQVTTEITLGGFGVFGRGKKTNN